MAEYQPILMRRSRRWEQLVTDGYDTVKWGSAKAKRFIRKGIPSDRRAEVGSIRPYLVLGHSAL